MTRNLLILRSKVTFFQGGHGTAAAVGSTLDTLGWAEGTDIGMTFATIGILAAMVHTVLE